MSQKRLSQRPKTFVKCYARFISRAFRYFCLLWVALCVTEISTATDEKLTHAQKLAQDALILFSHDHVLTNGHFQDARAGGVTAMTMELTVDNLRWESSPGVESVGPVGSGAAQVSITSFPFESMNNASRRFDDARSALMSIISPQGSGFRLVRTVQDIDAAKANGELGIIIATEGALMLGGNFPAPADADVLDQVESKYSQGWRKVQLYRVVKTPFVDVGVNDALSALGRRVVPMLNKRGVVIDAMHLSNGHIDDLFTRTNAPLHVSHDWNVCGKGYATTGPQQLDKIVASGGGHGVISVNALTSFYTQCGHRTGIVGFVDTLVDLIDRVGIDHVGIGPDYMPEGGADSWTLPANPGTPIPVKSLIIELLSRTLPSGRPRFTDNDIKKILGGNHRDLYQRIWDPTHGYDGGAANFRLCSNSDAALPCFLARSNGGQGDLRHRAINCGHPSGLTPVGMKLAYQNGAWVFKNLAGAWVPCATTALRDNGTSSSYPGSTLVVSWGDASYPQNGRIALHGKPPRAMRIAKKQ